MSELIQKIHHCRVDVKAAFTAPGGKHNIISLMSIKKKIALSFLISSGIIAALVAFQYVNYLEMKEEIRYLEFTDTLRSKSLQLRRHEKNFFLFSPAKAAEESLEVHRYLDELDAIVRDSLPGERAETASVSALISEYRGRFDKILALLRDVSTEFDRLKPSNRVFSDSFRLIEITFYERPSDSAVFLQSVLKMPPGSPLVRNLRELDAEIGLLREAGEAIQVSAKELDKRARDRVERGININQLAIIAFFPLSLIVGIGALFAISNNVVRRLNMLIGFVEKTGRDGFPLMPVPEKERGHDEVGVLMEKFNSLEEKLLEREEELERRGKELLQSKKLAAIGTLASGIAHELNNPLNNIFISAQALQKEAGEGCPPFVREVVQDIFGQTVRVKGIVSDLLEFAREKEPQMKRVELTGIIRRAFDLIGKISNVDKVLFAVDAPGEGVSIEADPEQMERVFLNLFSNAVDAMKGEGEVKVRVMAEREAAVITVSDTGAGISRDDMEKIFDPFFTTKEKGTGLGLAIVFNIIKKHGGEIAVESEKGRGTVFTITLPAGRA